MYCYSPSLFQYLRFMKGLSFICTGKHIDTGKQFWQFYRTPELEQAMNEYREIKANR